MRFSTLLAAILMAGMLAAPALAQNTTAGGEIQAGTFTCNESQFACDNLSSESSRLVEAGNACLKQNLHVKEDLLSSFTSSGENENCLVSRTYTDDYGFHNHANCCVRKVDEENCVLACTLYVGKK